MLFFLSLAAARSITVDSYTDQATGLMEKRPDGKTAMTKVILRPHARYSGDDDPDDRQIERLHHRAHEMCFIANSVTAEIITEVVA